MTEMLCPFDCCSADDLSPTAAISMVYLSDRRNDDCNRSLPPRFPHLLLRPFLAAAWAWGDTVRPVAIYECRHITSTPHVG